MKTPEDRGAGIMVKALGAIGSVIYRRSAAITDWFIPDSLRTDAATLGRARIFVFSHLFGPSLGQSISVYLYILDPNPGPAYWTIVASITAFWTLPFWLKLTGRLTPLALFTVENLTFVTLFGSYHYGGVSSPFLPWLLTALLLGFFYLGDRPVLVLSVFGVNILGFYVAYAVSGGFPQHIPLSQLSGVGIVSVISATIYVSMMAIYYANVVSSQSTLVREAERHRATAARMRKAMEVA